MDITKATKEQKTSAAVAYLSKHIDLAPEATKKTLEKLNVVNNEGMELVRNIQALKSQIEAIDAEIGEKIGGAKVLFEIVGDALSQEEVDKFAALFEPSRPKQPENQSVDIAGATAKKNVSVEK